MYTFVFVINCTHKNSCNTYINVIKKWISLDIKCGITKIFLFNSLPRSHKSCKLPFLPIMLGPKRRCANASNFRSSKTVNRDINKYTILTNIINSEIYIEKY